MGERDRSTVRFYLGTPRIFNSIRKELPSGSVVRPNIPMSRKEIIRFEAYNKKRSVFYFDLREFQRKHQQTIFSIYIVKTHLTTIQQASSPMSVLTLNFSSLTSEEIKKRSNEIKESFGKNFYENAVVLDMLKVILSAESYLCAYLDLPLTVRQCIEKP